MFYDERSVKLLWLSLQNVEKKLDNANSKLKFSDKSSAESFEV
jgi:hypothetical protein